jgi:type I restriction enzyme S subunit
MARALFNSWFVDFDPVRARAQGRDPGLPAHLADLFPGRLVESELGEIPEGWGVETLGGLLELSYGKALRDDQRQPGDIPVYGSNGQVGWHSWRLAEGPGIIVGRKGNPGVVTWAPTDFFAIDTTFFVVPKRRTAGLHFLFYALQQQDLATLSGDSAVPGLNRNLAYMSRQLSPPLPVTMAFQALAQPLFERRHQADEESRTLAALRDAVLPKLMSGGLHISGICERVNYG